MRADKRTWRRVEDELYSDFDTSFKKNPVTGSLVKVVNDDAVRQSVRNIILTTRGEWAYHPTLGSKVYHLLFEPLDHVTAEMIKEAVRAALQKESRITVRRVNVTPNWANDGYDLTIIYSIINRTEPVEFRDFLKRVR